MNIAAACVVIAALVLAVEPLRRISTALAFEPGELARGLGRTATDERLRRLASLVTEEGAGWESELLCDLVAARTEGERVALTNEHLGDLAAALGWGARISTVCARVSVAGPLAIAFFWIAGRSLSGRGMDDWPWLCPLFLWSLAGFFGASRAGQAVQRRAQELRKGVDALVAHSLTAARNGEPSEVRP